MGKIRNRICDLLIGFAIGDAFGAGVEFQDRDWIRANVDFSKLVNVRNQIKVSEKKKSLFVNNYHPWDYTDDTEMTIGTIKTILSNEVFSEDLLVEKWKEEYQLGMKNKGYGRNGHGSMSWFYFGEKSIEEIRAFQKNRPNPGNAPAMRAIPIGFVKEKRINDFAKINANATHPNINAIISSQCIARATNFLLVKNGDQGEIISHCFQTVKLNEGYKEYLNKVDKLGAYHNLSDADLEILCGPQPIVEPYFLPGIKGVPSDSKYTTGAVLYILKNSKDAMDALKKSILLGGDVDSIASICTGIMAYKFGLKEIPDSFIESVEGRKYLIEIGKAFENKKGK